jgi:hypothetical protein
MLKMGLTGEQITCIKASQGFDWNQGMFVISQAAAPWI